RSHGYRPTRRSSDLYIRPQVVEQPSEPEQPEPEEIKNQASLFDVVVGQLAGHGAKAHQIWLPPLDEPPPLNEMLPQLEVTQEYGLTTAGWEGRGKLYAMAGIVDKPFHQRRDPYWLEFSGGAGHVGIAGGPQERRESERG